MVDILHRVGIGAPLERVYETLTSLEGNRAWWDSNASGDATSGGTYSFEQIDEAMAAVGKGDGKPVLLPE